MNHRELSSPIMIYWDLATKIEPSHLSGICEEIISTRAFTLNLSDPSVPLGPDCIMILQRLRHESIAVSITISASALDPTVLQTLSGLGIKALFVDADSLETLQEAMSRIKNCGQKFPVGIHFRLTRDNFKQLPDALALCIHNSITNLVLPMQRTMSGMECFYLTSVERDELSDRLNNISIPETMKIVINDPFVWKVFYPSVQYPEGGCQAANTMIYISPEGNVYPCPAMDIKLGSLMNSTMKEILASDARTELRKELVSPPKGCLECKELSQCMGGCKGRTYKLKGSLAAPDPACE